jgi:hypothetical protein
MLFSNSKVSKLSRDVEAYISLNVSKPLRYNARAHYFVMIYMSTSRWLRAYPLQCDTALKHFLHVAQGVEARARRYICLKTSSIEKGIKC